MSPESLALLGRNSSLLSGVNESREEASQMCKVGFALKKVAFCKLLLSPAPLWHTSPWPRLNRASLLHFVRSPNDKRPHHLSQHLPIKESAGAMLLSHKAVCCLQRILKMPHGQRSQFSIKYKALRGNIWITNQSLLSEGNNLLQGPFQETEFYLKGIFDLLHWPETSAMPWCLGVSYISSLIYLWPTYIC